MDLTEAVSLLVEAYGVQPDGACFVFPGSPNPAEINEAWAALHAASRHSEQIITPAMLAAGAAVFHAADLNFESAEDVVAEIYEAMVTAEAEGEIAREAKPPRTGKPPSE